ncbi:MAG: hypothetical protein HZA90_08880 [Verrucomicrobia bacterium]|nr:hypothetical protein [Verrucomicrobiota bacterium]
MTRAADKLELPPALSLWHESATLRAGVGYKDNVTLSASEPRGSAFEQAGLDLMVFRLPWNDWQFSFFSSANDARYFDQTIGIDTEQNAAASTQFTWLPGRNWKSLTTLQYTYMNQVLDVLTTLRVASTRQQVLWHAVTARQGWRKDFAPYWIEASFGAGRNLLNFPLDDFWQGGPQLAVGRSYGYGSEVSLTYQAQRSFFDTYKQAQVDGSLLPDTSLEFTVQNAEINWQHQWDARRRWRTTTRLSFEMNQDNGPGYFDYRLYRLTEQLRYSRGTWMLSAQASLGHYDFLHRAIAVGSPETTSRTTVLLNVRGEKKLSQHWKVYATYDHEHSLSNLESERYSANVALAGVEFSF